MNGYDNDGKSAFWLSGGVVQNPLGEEKQVKKHRPLWRWVQGSNESDADGSGEE